MRAVLPQERRRGSEQGGKAPEEAELRTSGEEIRGKVPGGRVWLGGGVPYEGLTKQVEGALVVGDDNVGL